MKVTEEMVVAACDAQCPGWDGFNRSLWWPVLDGLRAALGDQSSPTIWPPDPPVDVEAGDG